METRKEKIQQLSRANRGRAAAPTFLANLSETLGETVGSQALQSLPETDILLAAFRTGYQKAILSAGSGHRRFFGKDDRAAVVRLADCLAGHLPYENVFFLTKLSSDCGAVDVQLTTLLKHTASIIRLDGDSLSALSKDRTQGVLIDYNPDDSLQTYEVAVWGNIWSELSVECGRAEF